MLPASYPARGGDTGEILIDGNRANVNMNNVANRKSAGSSVSTTDNV
jgi:hypothetical protein